MSEYQPNSRGDRDPFRLPLQEISQGKESKLANFEHDPRYIIRVEPLSDKKDNKLHRDALREFVKISNLSIPEYWDVIGESNGELVTFRVTKKINGIPMSEYFENPDDRIDLAEIAGFLNQIIHYVDHISNNNDLISIGDLRPDQFMYGRQEGDGVDKFYMVDLDNFTKSKVDPIYIRDVLKFCYLSISLLPPNELFTPILLEMVRMLDCTSDKLDNEYKDKLLLLRPYLLNQIRKNSEINQIR